ncbi:MAG: TonB-dependent receptor [Tannerella sp.]|jgi:TonB-linked SusC/RagA family outer membrane protein|nr:TonB-dependent receptor [Tannerella sp.]
MQIDRFIDLKCNRLTQLLIMLFIHALFSNGTSAQVKQLTIQKNNVTVGEVLALVEKEGQYVFFYADKDVDLSRKVSLNLRNQPVTKVLDELFKNTQNSYRVDGKQIFITKKAAQAVSSTTVSPDNVNVTGIISDEEGEALAGASVGVKGSTRGVMTDMDGKFTIDVKTSDVLEFSYIGYEKYVVEVGQQRTFIVRLEPKKNELDEVTVVAFARQKKESVVASISTINAKDLKTPSSNLTTAFAGRLAGVISYQRSGEPGRDNAQFFIRGVTTFGYKKDPLILIDGIEMESNDLARLQPDDIANFSIMKDATAAALYGSRGANGVILVNTKEGAEGKVKVDIRYETSMSRPTREVDLADPITYMRLHNEAVRTRDPLGVEPYMPDKIENTMLGLNNMAFPAVDWKSILFKKYAINNRLNFNLSGGGKVARYYISGGYSKDNGLLNVDGQNNFNNNIDLQRFILRTTVNINMTPTTEVVLRMYGTFDDYSGPLNDGGYYYNQLINTNPVLFPPVYRPDRRHEKAPYIMFGNAGTTSPQYTNPYADMVRGYRDYSESNMMAQGEVKQDLSFLLEGLKFRALLNTERYSYFDVTRNYNPYYFAIGSYDSQEDTYTLTSLNTGSEALQYSEGAKNINTTYYFEGAIDYAKTIDEKHSVTGLLVATMREYKNGNPGSLTLSLPQRNIGFAGRATYSYDSRYFLEANFGYNGSERFASKHRWGFFPSFGLGYLVSNEKFFLDEWKDKFNKLKLKFTHGLVGNDAIGSNEDRFFYLSNVNVTDGGKNINFGYDYGYNHPGGGVSMIRYANEDISWETAYKTNVGIELGLFKTFELQADYFYEHRTNILMTRSSIPTSIGLQQSPSANVGEATGQGIEFSLDYNKSFTKDLWLQANANFTYAVGKYKIYEEPDYPDLPWLKRTGRGLSQQWGFVAERLFVDEEEVRNSPTQTFGNQRTMAGDIKYKDINGDGRITDNDRVPIGYPTDPEIIYGFGTSSGYKDFDFSFFFQGSARSSFWVDAEATSPFINNQRALLKVYSDNYWSENDRDLYALWPRLTTQIHGNNTQRSTWFMRDGSFLRLKSVELGYSFTNRTALIRKLNVNMLRFYLSGTNLMTFSKFKLWDVEMGGNGLGYPVQMVLNAGVQLNF